MNIAILSGSARINNNTIRAGKALQLHFEQLGHQVSLIDFQHYDIPLLTQGSVNIEALTPFQKEIIEGMDHAQVVVLISPEYNWSTTPEILNMLHRLGEREFKHIFNNKVFALAGVSSGKGGKAPALHLVSILNKIISFMDLDSVVSAKIFESHFTKEVLDENGHSIQTNEAYGQGMSDFIRYTLRIAERWHQSRH